MITVNASKVLLESLKKYDVEHVFGLPGETTLPLYKEWLAYPEIEHVLCRDERSSVFMADVYSRFSFKPGICEGPSVGSTHMMPGVAEAFKSSTPLIILTSDIPLHYEKRNYPSPKNYFPFPTFPDRKPDGSASCRHRQQCAGKLRA